MAQAVYEGFILSRQQTNVQGRMQLCYWLSTNKGAVKALVEGERPVFFVRTSELEKVQVLLAGAPCEYKTLEMKHFDNSPMTACYFKNGQAYHQAKLALQHQIRVYEDDIRHCDRFLMERFVRGATWVKGDEVRRDGYIELSNAQLKANRHYTPHLTVLSLDIECDASGVLFSVGLVSEQQSHVIMIGEPVTDAPNYIVWVEDESALLRTLMEKVQQFNPDAIIGWNIIEFDFVILAERAEALGIELVLGKDQQPLHMYKGNYVHILISGRVVIDGIDTLKNATYHFDSFSLARVSELVLGETKLIEQDDRLTEIVRQFHEDKLTLAAYNLKDCELVLAIFNKLKLIDFAIARSRLTGLELEKMGGSVAAFTNLYLPLLHRSGYVAPNLAEHGFDFDSPGGYVMDSKPGLYRNVVVLDFKSLYPSIIRTFRIDPLGLIKGLVSPDEAIKGFNKGFFSRDEHHLPELVGELAQARQQAKVLGDQMLSQAIKIIMNSLYGVLGSKGCRFYDPRLSSSITLRGHQIMQQSKQLIESLGHEVIYGDTDSTFVKLPDDWDEKQCTRTANELVNKVNEFWQVWCGEKYDISSYLELEFETLYHRFFMPTIRGQSVGSKKRYVGETFVNGAAQLVFKGMESVRSDWTDIAKEYQQDVIKAMFAGQELYSLTKRYIDRVYSGEVDGLLLYSKRLGKDIENYTKNIPPHVKAAKHASKNNDGKKYRKGSKIRYYITKSGPRTSLGGEEIDYEHYVDKQIYPILMMMPNYESVLFKLKKQRGFLF